MTEVATERQRKPTVAHAMRAYLLPTETFIYNQISSLQRYHPVVVAHQRRTNTPFPLADGAISQELLKPREAGVERFAYRYGRVALRGGNRALVDFMADQGVEILHYHYLTDARFLVSLKRQFDVPAIVSCYGYDVASFPERWGGMGRRYLQSTFETMDLFLAMSDDMKTDMLSIGVPEDRIHVHYHGVDTTRFRFPERSYAATDRTQILYVGALLERKGPHLVIEALRRIEGESPLDWELTFVGDGTLRHRLEETVETLGWSQRVNFVGHVNHLDDHLIDFYRRADVFMHPSVKFKNVKEGIPGTIVEAMASGLPVISSYHAGIPAVIDSGVHGLLADEHDVNQLAVHLRSLIEKPELRQRLGTAAAVRAISELDLHARTEQLELIYSRFS